MDKSDGSGDIEKWRYWKGIFLEQEETGIFLYILGMVMKEYKEGFLVALKNNPPCLCQISYNYWK